MAVVAGLSSSSLEEKMNGIPTPGGSVETSLYRPLDLGVRRFSGILAAGGFEQCIELMLG